MTKPTKRLDPIPPGEIFAGEIHAAEWAEPESASARDIDVNPARINAIVPCRPAELLILRYASEAANFAPPSS
jgi:hypothetical protein